jgi:hypothetical protein
MHTGDDATMTPPLAPHNPHNNNSSSHNHHAAAGGSANLGSQIAGDESQPPPLPPRPGAGTPVPDLLWLQTDDLHCAIFAFACFFFFNF